MTKIAVIRGKCAFSREMCLRTACSVPLVYAPVPPRFDKCNFFKLFPTSDFISLKSNKIGKNFEKKVARIFPSVYCLL